jgi:aspartate/methionine/tyrosine aminotransferase
MEVGQPATLAPKAARERARQALEDKRLGYTEALGMPSLRERIARFMGERYGVAVSPERVVVTSGSSAGFVLALLVLLDQGDALGLPSPGYPCYRQILKALGISPLLVETSGQGRWMPTVADVGRLAAAGAAGLLFASPNNPTGTMALPPRLGELAEACRQQGLWLISDEIYHGLEYEAPAETALAHTNDAIVVNSFSKYFSMTGWRIGWLVVPEVLVPGRSNGSPRVSTSRYLARRHLAGSGARRFRRHRRARTDQAELCAKPRHPARRAAAGRPLLDPSRRRRILSLCGCEPLHGGQRSLRQGHAQGYHIGVATTPGVDFDPERGSIYLRLCYAGAEDAMDEAARRITAWLKTRWKTSRMLMLPLRPSVATSLCGVVPPARFELRPAPRRPAAAR